MNRNSNTYTVLYAIIMVVVVATVLAVAATSLAQRQASNVLTEKMGAILGSIGEAKGAGDADNKDLYIKEEFKKFITTTLLINASGEATKVEADKALATLDKLPKIYADKQALPLFVAALPDQTLYVIPITGKGLWGAVWGYVALKADFNTIYGIKFDHKSETPGLGAEISQLAFGEKFIGKQFFDNDVFKSITLVKGSAETVYEVDAITGGTLTCNGVNAMLLDCISAYAPYLIKEQKATNSIPMTKLTPALQATDSIPLTKLTPALEATNNQ